MPILMAIIDVALEEKTAIEAFKGFVLNQSGLAPYFNFLKANKTEKWQMIKNTIKNRIKAQVMSFVPGSRYFNMILNFFKGNFQLEELLERKAGDLIKQGLRKTFGNKAISAVDTYLNIKKSRIRRLAIINKKIATIQKLYDSLEIQDGKYSLIRPRDNNTVFKFDAKKQVLGKYYRRYLQALRAVRRALMHFKSENNAINVARSKVEIGFKRASQLEKLQRRNFKFNALVPWMEGRIAMIYDPARCIDNEYFKAEKTALEEEYMLIAHYLLLQMEFSKENIPSQFAAMHSSSMSQGLDLFFTMNSTAISKAMFIPTYDVAPNDKADIFTEYGTIVVVFIKTPDKEYAYYDEPIAKWYDMLYKAIPDKAGWGAWSLMGYAHRYGYNKKGQWLSVMPSVRFNKYSQAMERAKIMKIKTVRHHKKLRSVSHIKPTTFRTKGYKY